MTEIFLPVLSEYDFLLTCLQMWFIRCLFFISAYYVYVYTILAYPSIILAYWADLALI